MGIGEGDDRDGREKMERKTGAGEKIRETGMGDRNRSGRER